jgi:3-oxoadipate enol-lactonase
MSQTLNHVVEGRGPNVVLLHPVGLDLTSWDAVARRLAAQYRILRVDLRGHGQSPKNDDGMELSDFAADVHNLLMELDFTPTAVVGLSFGGMVAQALALDFRDDVGQLVVAGCPCTLPDAGRIALSARGRAAIENGMPSQITETLERWFTPGFVAGGRAEAIRRRLETTDPAAWNAGWQAISRIDTATRLKEIAVPTLCIAGALDPASPPAALAEIARRVPGARLLVLPGTPHMMQVEQPDLFAAAVETFLSGQPIGEIAAM